MNDERVRYTKELPEPPAQTVTLHIRREGDLVIMEPSPIHGVRGFTISMSRAGAMGLADQLNDAAGR